MVARKRAVKGYHRGRGQSLDTPSSKATRDERSCMEAVAQWARSDFQSHVAATWDQTGYSDRSFLRQDDRLGELVRVVVDRHRTHPSRDASRQRRKRSRTEAYRGVPARL